MMIDFLSFGSYYEPVAYIDLVFIHESCQKSAQLYANTEGASTETKRFFRKKSLYRGNSDLWFPLI